MTASKGHFAEGRQAVWDSTTLSSFKTCAKKYDLAFRQDYTPLAPNEHLKFGILAHRGREQYYKQRLLGYNHDAAVQITTHDISREMRVPAEGGGTLPWVSTHKTKDHYHLLLLLITYLDHFKDDRCETYLLENGKPAVELSFKLEIQPPWMLSGHIDRVVNFDGEVYLTDLKTTTATLNDHYFEQYKPDNQISLYDFAGQIILPKKPVGVIVDAIQILADGINLMRRIITRTDAEREEWYNELIFWLRLHENYAQADFWPRNDTSCSHFGGCQFRGVCSLPPHLRHHELNARFQKKIWDPTQNR